MERERRLLCPHTDKYYGGDSLCSWKGLDRPNFYKYGLVMPMYMWSLPSKNDVIVTAPVSHSQKLNEPQLKPWVKIRMDRVVWGGGGHIEPSVEM